MDEDVGKRKINGDSERQTKVNNSGVSENVPDLYVAGVEPNSFDIETDMSAVEEVKKKYRSDTDGGQCKTIKPVFKKQKAEILEVETTMNLKSNIL